MLSAGELKKLKVLKQKRIDLFIRMGIIEKKIEKLDMEIFNFILSKYE